MKTSILATGDSFITKRADFKNEDFQEIKNLISSYDVKFNNLEITIHNKEGYPAAFSGGTWAMAEPEVLETIREYGFNLLNTANNHSLDYSHGGLEATIRYLEDYGFTFSGTGVDLLDASTPKYLTVNNTKVALIGVSSTFHDSDIPGNSSDDIHGRPGVNPLRFIENYYIEKEDFDRLKEIIEKTDINSYEDFKIKNGYSLPTPENQLNFGGHRFFLGDKTRKETIPHPKDMERLIKGIREAKDHADVVLVSIHSHELQHADPVCPADFYTTCARLCIEAGADAILGHGPHELRGIEIYQGKPIFYSLGNFIFQTETVSLQPAEAYESKGFPKGTTVKQYMNARSKNGTSGYIVQPNIWRSVMAGFEIEDGKISQIKLFPIAVGLQEDKSVLFPTLSKDDETLRYLATLSEAFGTAITIEDHVGIISL